MRRERFQAARQAMVRTFLGEGVLDVLHAVRKKAVAGDMVAARLYLQCAGMLDEHSRITVDARVQAVGGNRAAVEALATNELLALQPLAHERLMSAQTNGPADAARLPLAESA